MYTREFGNWSRNEIGGGGGGGGVKNLFLLMVSVVNFLVDLGNEIFSIFF